MLIPFYCDELDYNEHEVIVEYLYCNNIKSEPEKIYILGIFKKLSYDTFLITIQYKDENDKLYEIKTIHQMFQHPNLYDVEKIPFLQYCMLKENSILNYDEDSKNLYCKYHELNTFDLFHDWKQIS